MEWTLENVMQLSFVAGVFAIAFAYGRLWQISITKVVDHENTR